MRRTPALIMACLVGVTVAVTAIGAPAQAATNKVTIRPIASQTAAVDSPTSKVTIKPSVTKSGKVRLRASRLTVTQGSRTLVRNKNAAAVAAGSYKVTTTVKYKTYTTKKGKKKYSRMKTKAVTQSLTIYGPCAKPADFASVKVQPVPPVPPVLPVLPGQETPTPGDSIATVAKKLHHAGVASPSVVVPMSNSYPRCGTAENPYQVVFANGTAVRKSGLTLG